ncbi:MAG: hypothetical protein EOO11_01970 [Chitinophagaceae bacterium]|nr:MAG: hypothetical protein EOO11_01970 [Chitinophagaceae bacterium]
MSYLIYRVVEKACIKTYTSFQKNEEFFRKRLSYDCLLLGSSRMEHTVNPASLDSVLGTHSYNAGADGAQIQEMKMLLEAGIRMHGKPKLAVVSLDLGSLAVDKTYRFYPIYMPHLDVPEVSASLKEQGFSVGTYRALPFLRLIEMDDYYKGALLKAVRHESHPKERFLLRGYEGATNDTVVPEKLQPITPHDEPLNPAGRQGLHDLIQLCRQQGIRLCLVYSPEFNAYFQQRVTNSAQVFRFYDSIARANSVPFLRNDTLPMCSESRYFANSTHVNIEGARVYSAILGGQLKTLFP